MQVKTFLVLLHTVTKTNRQMKHLRLLAVLAIIALIAITSCTNKQKTQYVGTWILSGISLDGENWDETVMPEDDMTITINNDGTLLMTMGEYNEEDQWVIDKEGNIIMGEQPATIDDNGYLVADHNGTIVRMKRK